MSRRPKELCSKELPSKSFTKRFAQFGLKEGFVKPTSVGGQYVVPVGASDVEEIGARTKRKDYVVQRERRLMIRKPTNNIPGYKDRKNAFKRKQTQLPVAPLRNKDERNSIKKKIIRKKTRDMREYVKRCMEQVAYMTSVPDGRTVPLAEKAEYISILLVLDQKTTIMKSFVSELMQIGKVYGDDPGVASLFQSLAPALTSSDIMQNLEVKFTQYFETGIDSDFPVRDPSDMLLGLFFDYMDNVLLRLNRLMICTTVTELSEHAPGLLNPDELETYTPPFVKSSSPWFDRGELRQWVADDDVHLPGNQDRTGRVAIRPTCRRVYAYVSGAYDTQTKSEIFGPELAAKIPDQTWKSILSRSILIASIPAVSTFITASSIFGGLLTGVLGATMAYGAWIHGVESLRRRQVGRTITTLSVNNTTIEANRVYNMTAQQNYASAIAFAYTHPSGPVPRNYKPKVADALFTVLVGRFFQYHTHVFKIVSVVDDGDKSPNIRQTGSREYVLIDGGDRTARIGRNGDLESMNTGGRRIKTRAQFNDVYSIDVVVGVESIQYSLAPTSTVAVISAREGQRQVQNVKGLYARLKITDLQGLGWHYYVQEGRDSSIEGNTASTVLQRSLLFKGQRFKFRPQQVELYVASVMRVSAEPTTRHAVKLLPSNTQNRTILRFKQHWQIANNPGYNAKLFNYRNTGDLFIVAKTILGIYRFGTISVSGFSKGLPGAGRILAGVHEALNPGLFNTDLTVSLRNKVFADGSCALDYVSEYANAYNLNHGVELTTAEALAHLRDNTNSIQNNAVALAYFQSGEVLVVVQETTQSAFARFIERCGADQVAFWTQGPQRFVLETILTIVGFPITLCVNIQATGDAMFTAGFATLLMITTALRVGDATNPFNWAFLIANRITGVLDQGYGLADALQAEVGVLPWIIATFNLRGILADLSLQDALAWLVRCILFPIAAMRYLQPHPTDQRIQEPQAVAQAAPVV